MATYVNDLRLKEIATGDEAGTWGTSTNTNLELIGEALGYGTQDCFASDADATTTVADGASDPARAMYFKVTSSATLTATRTLTIAPNTISRVMLIENATTGSQSITISQGSGSTVTIASGAVKMVYLDGAGAGGAVVEALADLELPTVTVADLTATTADINAGTIDGTVIGGSTAAAITGTTITGTSFVSSGDMTFGDSDKAIFGAGSDLQIYHDGSDSYITHTTGGNFFINDDGAGYLMMKGSDLYFRNPSNVDMIHAQSGGFVKLYYNGVAKLATTSTGIDVTGTVTADGLTMASGSQGVIGVFGTSGLQLIGQTGSDNIIGTMGVNEPLVFRTVSTEKMRIASNGDISFYEDTGTTAKFSWSSANETISIGSGASSTATISAYSRTVSASLPSALRIIENTGASTYWDIGSDGGASPNLKFYVNANTTPKVTFTSSGNVDIAGTATADKVTIGTSSASNGKLTLEGVDGADSAGIYFNNTTATNGKSYSLSSGNSGEFMLYDRTSSAYRLFVSSAGNVGIGTSSPSYPFHVTGSGDTVTAVTAGASSIAALNLGNSTNLADGGIRYDNGADALILRASNAERMRIDSSGNVGIGTSSPTANLVVTQSGNTPTSGFSSSQWQGCFVNTGTTTSIARVGIYSGNATTALLNFGDADDADIGGLAYDNSDNSLAIRTNNAEAMRIDSSGNVGIGVSTPSNNHANANNLVVGNGTAGGIANYVGTGLGWYAFSRANSNNSDAYDGGISYDGSRNLMFHTNAGAERMRINSSGSLLVGKTVTTFNTEGFLYEAGAAVEITTDSNRVMRLNRTTNDGNILEFNKDGTTVGSIGTVDGDFNVFAAASGHKGLRFGNGFIAPTSNSTTVEDNTVDLGLSTHRFKNLYLSGGVYLGGTGAANLLDDYEEGTWTPTVSSGITSPTYAVQTGRYTKIGNRVFYDLYIQTTGGTANSSHVIFSGLPFSGAANTGSASIAFSNSNFRSTNDPTNFFVSGTTLETYEAAGSTLIGTELGDATFDLRMSGTYMV
jgi:hypothetical protein